jgi:carbon storage regulator
MLILSRKSGESIVIDGRIKVTIIRVEGEAIKVGIEAPSEVQVHRQEVYEEVQRNNQQAITRQKVPLPKFAAPISLKQKGSSPAAVFKPELRKP